MSEPLTHDPRSRLTASRRRLAAAGALGTCVVVAVHVAVLLLDGHDAVADPVSALSRAAHGHWHTAALVVFALAHLAVARALWGRHPGWLWRAGCVLLALGGAGIAGVAVYFATADPTRLAGPDANDPLSVVASVIGVAMAALQRGWRSLQQSMAWFNGACLIVWLALVPLILLVDDTWLGGYERLVGTTYAVWMLGLALSAGTTRSRG